VWHKIERNGIILVSLDKNKGLTGVTETQGWGKRVKPTYHGSVAFFILGLLLASALVGLVSVAHDNRSPLARIDLGPHPAAMTIDARRSRAFVADTGDGTVRVVDTRARTVLRTVVVGGRPRDIAVDTTTGHVFVVAQGSTPTGDSVSMLDAGTGKRLRTVVVGREATAIALDERRRQAFVINRLSNTISVLDTRRGGVSRTLPMDAATGGDV